MCALMADHTVACKGDNSLGQLGVGDTSVRTEVVRVPGLTDVVAIAGTQGNHTCALRADSSVACWGEDADGEVGNGRTEPSTPAATTVAIGPALEITGGPRNACALLADGSVWCWGENLSGQLGDGVGDALSRGTPAAVINLGKRAIDVGLGGSQDYYHTCVMLEDHSMRCMGNNVFGQIGPNAPLQIRNPVPVEMAVPHADTIAPGGNNRTCALTETGGAECWGHEVGQLAVTTPQPIAGVSSPVQVVMSMLSICFRYRDGTVACANSAGVVDLSPSPVPGIDDAVELAAGETNVCARCSSNEIWCWTNDSQPVKVDLSPP
jgi:alpha-tubulin suppressor-like RCC1 family protein